MIKYTEIRERELKIAAINYAQKSNAYLKQI